MSLESHNLQHGDDPSPNSDTNSSFWTRNRLIAIAVFLAVIILIGIGVWIYLANQQTNKSVSTATANSSAKSSDTHASVTRASWKGTVDPTAIPLGDGKVSSSPKAGYVYSCTTNFRGGGARHAGEWLDEVNGTWDSTTKVSVKGSVIWAEASYKISTTGSTRVLVTDNLPVKDPTGIFPIARNDPAYQYDTNPNGIGIQNLTYKLPVTPKAAASPGCTSLGAIGVMANGVVLFNALDDAGRDAAAHETQDLCDGHPNGKEMYHYHDVPTCIMIRAKGSSTLVGYALDGYGIYVERDTHGNLPTNADLDECHGRTSEVTWDGKPVTMYHYDATLEYPYTIGCFHGTSVEPTTPADKNAPAKRRGSSLHK